MRRVVAFAAALALQACGGGGETTASSAAPTSSNVVANPGQDSTAVAGMPVRLDATASYSKLGGTLTFQWTQTAGAAVVLSDATAAAPSFVAPAAPGDLTFQVSATSAGETGSASMTVHVKPFAVRAGLQRTSSATSGGGATTAGTNLFTIAGGADFTAAGVAPGDTLVIADGADFGAYRIDAVNDPESLTVHSPAAFAGRSPASWTILNESPYALGYGVAVTLDVVLLGTATGTVTFAWTGATLTIPVTGAATSAVSFVTPKLDRLETIPEDAGVLTIRGTSMQLKVTVTADNGTDARIVNASAGQMNGGLENAPLGEPLFLNGGTIRKPKAKSGFVLASGAFATYETAEDATVRAVRQNQTNLTVAASAAAVETTPGSWFAGGGTLSIRATDSSAVDTNDFSYDAFAADTWIWSVTDPTGAQVPLLRPDRTPLGAAFDERTPFFVPARIGKYQVLLTRTAGAQVDFKSFTLNVAQHVGVGIFTGIAPDPQVGECGSCHGGAIFFLENIRDEWLQTPHAKVFTDGMTPGTPSYAIYQSKSDWRDVDLMTRHTTGMEFTNPLDLSQSSMVPAGTGHLPNGGFDDVAQFRNWNHVGMTWDTLKDLQPSIADFGNVQCEACHGPGSLHKGDTTAIRKSFDSGNCARCHADLASQGDFDFHSHVVSVAAGISKCINCHEASASVKLLKAAAMKPAPRSVFSADPTIPTTLLVPEFRRRGQTCQVCHDPHASSGGEHQLRFTGTVKLLNGAVTDAGKAALCYMCHNSRVNTLDFTPVTGDMAIRSAPHDSTAADMIAKTNAVEYPGASYKSSPHGVQTGFVIMGQTENKHCITCHMAPTPGAGKSGAGVLGGHSFRLAQGGAGDFNQTVANQSLNSGAATVAGTKAFGVVGGPTFLGRVAPGDSLFLQNGSDVGLKTIDSTDNGGRITVKAAANFNGLTPPTTWRIDSVPKQHLGACAQCHDIGALFAFTARDDYDGDGLISTVQTETSGMLAKLKFAIESGLNDPALPKALGGGGPFSIVVVKDTVSYANATGKRPFPGPSGTSPQQDDWDALDATQQAKWEQLFKATYDYFFVVHDRSNGLHNTGYVVGVLQSAFFDLTATPMGAPFVPVPGYEN